MVRRLALAVGLAALGCLLSGCYSVGPNDPDFTAAEKKEMRKDAYTPQQLEARSRRPR